MSSVFDWLRSALKKNVFAFAAFLIPLVVRSVPEFLSWPYPIGFDTVAYYIPLIRSGWVFSLGPIGFFKTTGMFYLLSSLSYGLTNNVIFVVKIFGPLLFGVLCFLMYLYARRVLGWGCWKSLLLVVLISTFFVSLAISWTMYRQILGLIFLMATLLTLKSFSSSKRYYAVSAFMVLAVLSHEFAAVLLFFIIFFEAIRLLFKKSRKDLGYLLSSSVLPFALFLFQRYSSQQGSFGFVSSSLPLNPSVDLSLYMGGLLIYCYALIIPFVFLGLRQGLKDPSLKYWALLCLSIFLLEMIIPSIPLAYWYRWILLLVYPFLFFAVQGLERFWHFSWRAKGRISRLVPKILVIAYLVMIFVVSGFYITSTPENSYFGKSNPYLSIIPSSMLQNSLSIKDNPSLVNCLNWLNQNTSKSSVMVEHEALAGYVSIYVPDKHVVSIPADLSLWSNTQNETMIANNVARVARNASDGGRNSVYMVWWIHGEGWYMIPSLPSSFVEIYRSGNLAVYWFNETSNF